MTELPGQLNWSIHPVADHGPWEAVNVTPSLATLTPLLDGTEDLRWYLNVGNPFVFYFEARVPGDGGVYNFLPTAAWNLPPNVVGFLWYPRNVYFGSGSIGNSQFRAYITLPFGLNVRFGVGIFGQTNPTLGLGGPNPDADYPVNTDDLYGPMYVSCPGAIYIELLGWILFETPIDGSTGGGDASGTRLWVGTNDTTPTTCITAVLLDTSQGLPARAVSTDGGGSFGSQTGLEGAPFTGGLPNWAPQASRYPDPAFQNRLARGLSPDAAYWSVRPVSAFTPPSSGLPLSVPNYNMPAYTQITIHAYAIPAGYRGTFTYPPHPFQNYAYTAGDFQGNIATNQWVASVDADGQVRTTGWQSFDGMTFHSDARAYEVESLNAAFYPGVTIDETNHANSRQFGADIGIPFIWASAPGGEPFGTAPSTNLTTGSARAQIWTNGVLTTAGGGNSRGPGETSWFAPLSQIPDPSLGPSVDWWRWSGVTYRIVDSINARISPAPALPAPVGDPKFTTPNGTSIQYTGEVGELLWTHFFGDGPGIFVFSAQRSDGSNSELDGLYAAMQTPPARLCLREPSTGNWALFSENTDLITAEVASREVTGNGRDWVSELPVLSTYLGTLLDGSTPHLTYTTTNSGPDFLLPVGANYPVGLPARFILSVCERVHFFGAGTGAMRSASQAYAVPFVSQSGKLRLLIERMDSQNTCGDPLYAYSQGRRYVLDVPLEDGETLNTNTAHPAICLGRIVDNPANPVVQVNLTDPFAPVVDRNGRPLSISMDIPPVPAQNPQGYFMQWTPQAIINELIVLRVSSDQTTIRASRLLDVNWTQKIELSDYQPIVGVAPGAPDLVINEPLQEIETQTCTGTWQQFTDPNDGSVHSSVVWRSGAIYGGLSGHWLPSIGDYGILYVAGSNPEDLSPVVFDTLGIPELLFSMDQPQDDGTVANPFTQPCRASSPAKPQVIG